MKTQTDRTQESQNPITPRVTSEPSDGGTAQLVDNRTSTIDQQKLRTTMNTSTDNSANPLQLKASPERSRRANNTGLSDNLKSGIENLSGYSMDDVKVHYNSSKPAQLQAHAYAQGTDIHLAPGQKKHLPHEAWHVVQQKQGRVKPTRQLKGKVNINDNAGLEKEADVMGARAAQNASGNSTSIEETQSVVMRNNGVLQRVGKVNEDIWKKIDENTWQAVGSYAGTYWILQNKRGQLLISVHFENPSLTNAMDNWKGKELTYEEWGLELSRAPQYMPPNPVDGGSGPDTTHQHVGLAHWQQVAANHRGKLDELHDKMWPRKGLDPFGVNTSKLEEKKDKKSENFFKVENGFKRKRLRRIGMEELIAVPSLMINHNLFNKFEKEVKKFPLHKYNNDPWQVLEAWKKTLPPKIMYRAIVLDRDQISNKPAPTTFGNLLSARCAKKGDNCKCTEEPGNIETELKAHVGASTGNPRIYQSAAADKSLAIAVANTNMSKMNYNERLKKVVVLFTLETTPLDMIYFGHVDSKRFATEYVQWARNTTMGEKVKKYSPNTELIATSTIPQEMILAVEIVENPSQCGVVEEKLKM